MELFFRAAIMYTLGKLLRSTAICLLRNTKVAAMKDNALYSLNLTHCFRTNIVQVWSVSGDTANVLEREEVPCGVSRKCDTFQERITGLYREEESGQRTVKRAVWFRMCAAVHSHGERASHKHAQAHTHAKAYRSSRIFDTHARTLHAEEQEALMLVDLDVRDG